jgi:drug/metabolite transporter (DMT)-like permease
LPTFLATELGILVALLILLPVTFFVKKEAIQLDIKSNRVLLLQAVFGVLLYRVFTFCGLKFTSAANSGLITSASAAMVAVLAYFILKEKLYFNRVAGVLSVSAGVVVINLYAYFSQSSGQAGSIKGNMLIMAAVICEALFSILSKVKCKPMSPLYRTTMITLYAFICLLPFAIYDSLTYDFMKVDHSSVICVVYYGVFVSFLSYVLWFKGIEKVSASNAAVFTSVVPVSSIFLSAVVLKEPIVVAHIIGLVCIISGICISCIHTKDKKEVKMR